MSRLRRILPALAAVLVASEAAGATLDRIEPIPGSPLLTEPVAAFYIGESDYLLALNLDQTVQAGGLIAPDGGVGSFWDFDLFVLGLVNGGLVDAGFGEDRLDLLYEVAEGAGAPFGAYAIVSLLFEPGSFDDRAEALSPLGPLSQSFLLAELRLSPGIAAAVPLPPALALQLAALGAIAFAALRRRP